MTRFGRSLINRDSLSPPLHFAILIAVSAVLGWTFYVLGWTFPAAWAFIQSMAYILLVEDSEMYQKVVRRVLEPRGHEVSAVGLVKDAVPHLARGNIDLILMDLNLPDAKGEDAIRVIRDTLMNDTPIVVISGEITVDTVAALSPFGVRAFVAKESDFPLRLLEAISKALTP